MPDLLDDSLPPEPIPLPPAPLPSGPGLTQGPNTAPRPKPQKAAPLPELKVADTERLRPPAAIQKKIKGEMRWVLAVAGVIGDLDAHGLDLLAGHIALLNGVSFAASDAFKHRNPGGFGITLWPPNQAVSPSHIYPSRGSDCAQPWMNQLYHDLQLLSGQSKVADRRQRVRPVTFPSWKAGGEALSAYLQAIQMRRIPYFLQGPMTPIAEVLLCFEAPFTAAHTFAWSDLLPVLEAHGAAPAAAQP